MAQKKLFRFAEIKTFPNVLEYPENMKGKWKDFFKNDNPIILELACGRGEYTIGLAQLFPNKNFIGVDIKGNRMYIGAKKAIEQNLNNAAFLRTQISKLNDYFTSDEVDEIWITFPDPQLRASKAKKRLTHPRFLNLYHQILKPNGIIHLKTDSPQLFDFTKTVIQLFNLNLISENENIYADKEIDASLNIKTHYEKMDIARSNRTHYLSFTLPKILPQNEDELKAIIYETNN
ncbi:MAG: tRNA (guanosine(46)-N7)-methyltransferase TrmB [Ferruginibacter sp.]